VVRGLLALVVVISAAVAIAASSAASPPGQIYRIDHVADGDTVDLTNGERVRLVQIDTPEVYPDPECFGRQASAETKRLLPPGTLVRMLPEPATDRVDQYGRLLRYVIRAADGLNVNLRLVADGAAAPYFYDRRRGRFAARIEMLARDARASHLGLWSRCPGTPYDPYRGVATG
jgi:micrococcal nuclease